MYFFLFAQKMKVVYLFRLSHKTVIACRAPADGAREYWQKYVLSLWYTKDDV